MTISKCVADLVRRGEISQGTGDAVIARARGFREEGEGPLQSGRRAARVALKEAIGARTEFTSTIEAQGGKVPRRTAAKFNVGRAPMLD